MCLMYRSTVAKSPDRGVKKREIIIITSIRFHIIDATSRRQVCHRFPVSSRTTIHLFLEVFRKKINKGQWKWAINSPLKRGSSLKTCLSSELYHPISR